MIGVIGRGLWTGAPAALVLAQSHSLAADGWVPGSHKHRKRMYLHHATDPLKQTLRPQQSLLIVQEKTFVAGSR